MPEPGYSRDMERDFSCSMEIGLTESSGRVPRHTGCKARSNSGRCSSQSTDSGQQGGSSRGDRMGSWCR